MEVSAVKKQKLNDKRKIPLPQARPTLREPGVPDATRVIHSMEPNPLDGEGG